jgi:hypothetical protein|tara:strand:- start:50 stop:271 length:222 start_codon:yes stop_codon:yes gene_type:complete
MDYEVEDFRKQKEPPSWLDWQPIRPWNYLFSLLAFLFLLPYLLGFIFSPFGLLTNCILIDYILYWGAMKRGEY